MILTLRSGPEASRCRAAGGRYGVCDREKPGDYRARHRIEDVATPEAFARDPARGRALRRDHARALGGGG
jgi:hypothetical protein